MDLREHELTFRPRARLVSILGEHLISDHAVGLIELVKNSYDADATEVIVEIVDTGDTEKTCITIRDNGCGMNLEDIRLKWLSPAADHKKPLPTLRRLLAQLYPNRRPFRTG
jgi:anti-sigma regulatory factor (Ser/Thr protein kinase)